MYLLTTTTERIDACNPCDERRNRAAQLLGITKPSEKPISYVELIDTLGLEDALWCCRAEPGLTQIWRRYAVWCAQQVQHVRTDQRSLKTLDLAERHAIVDAIYAELAAARHADAAAAAAAWAAAWAAAFRQLVTTGTLPTLLTSPGLMSPETLQAITRSLAMTLDGFYPAQAVNSYRLFIYTTHDGKEVEVTLTTPSTKPGHRWPDTVFVGPVVNFVREANA